MTKETTSKRFMKNILTGCVPILMLLVIILASCKNKSHYAGPLTPEESMKTFHFAENFKAEIFATEPLVIDPVS
ncbi:MAG TPA: dehydrogenase, partial [Hanamia sp.]